MIFVKYREENGVVKESLFDTHTDWFRATFSPEINELCSIEFKTHGADFYERKESVRELAKDFQTHDEGGLSYLELSEIQNWFTKMGIRYGLLTEFRENGVI